ncbi:MAG: hypothetical protein ACRECP_10765, partial [Methylocella sp.]
DNGCIGDDLPRAEGALRSAIRADRLQGCLGFTIAEAQTGVTGSGKSIGPDEFLARACLCDGMGGLVPCAEGSLRDRASRADVQILSATLNSNS